MALAIASPARAVSLLPGDILVLGTSTEVGAGIIHVDPATNAQTLVAPGAFGDFAVAPNGSLYATVGDSVVRIDPSTGAQTTVSSGGLLVPSQPFDETTPGDSFIAANNESVFVARQYDQRVIRINPTSGAQSILSEGGLFLGSDPDGPGGPIANNSLHGTVDLALGPSNDLLTLENRAPTYAEVVRIALDTGVQTSAFLDTTSGGHFGDPAGLGVSVGGQMFGGDRLVSQHFFELHPQLGTIQLLVPEPIPHQYAMNVAVETSGKLLLVRGVGELVRFDRVTNELEYLAFGGFTEVEVVPAPEPATATLLALGIAGIAASRRSRRRAQQRAR